MLHKYRRLNDGTPWLTFGVFRKPEDPPADPPKTDPPKDPPADPAKDPAEKEGTLEIVWKVDDKGRKFFTGPDGTKFYPEDAVTKTVSERLNEDRKKRKDDEEKAAREKNGEFEKLYGEEQKKASELAPKAEKADRLAAVMHKNITAQIKDWPAELKDVIPGEDTDVEVRAELVTKLTPAAKKALAGSAVDGEHGDRGGKEVKDVAKTYVDTTYKRPSERNKK